jgi:hypothetical protein
MFKLADPESGRRAIQIWDEKGTKLFTTLLTIPDEQPEAKNDPVVLFSERPSGAAPAVKSWFYPAERTGYEFIYPKDQAIKIAAAAKTPVLAYNTDVKSDADESALRAAQVGRVDAQGQAAADNTAASSSTTTTTSSTTAANAAPPANADVPDANRTSAPPAAPTTPTNTAAAASTTTTAPAAPAATSRADASSSTRTAVGTTGQVDRAAQAQSAQPARPAQELPRTASPLATLQLVSVVLIASALGVRQLRRRYAVNR